jgi:hypothetical protein
MCHPPNDPPGRTIWRIISIFCPFPCVESHAELRSWSYVGQPRSINSVRFLIMLSIFVLDKSTHLCETRQRKPWWFWRPLACGGFARFRYMIVSFDW